MIKGLLNKIFSKAPAAPKGPPPGTLYGRSAGRLEGDPDPHFREDHDYEAEDNKPVAPPQKRDPLAQDGEAPRLPPGMLYGDQSYRKDEKSS